MIKVNLLRDATQVTMKRDATLTGTAQVVRSGNSDVVIKFIILFLPAFISIGGLSYVESTKKAELSVIHTLIAQKGQEVQRLGPEIEAVANFKKEKVRLQVQIDTIKTLSRERLRNVKALEALQSLIPEKAWLTLLKINENKVEFEGRSVDDKDVADFMAGLEENIYFSGVRLIRTGEQQTKEGVVKEFAVESLMEGL